MATTPTTNYAWGKPTVGASNGVWGTELNAALDEIDTDLAAAEATADAALPKAGGTLTGDLVHLTDSYTLVDLGNMTGAVEIDLSAGNFFYGTVTESTTISFANCPTGGVFFLLELTNPGAASISWPGAVKWPGGTAPDFTASGVDLLSGITRDAATTVRMALVQEDSA
jgi:hypothetical protein